MPTTVNAHRSRTMGSALQSTTRPSLSSAPSLMGDSAQWPLSLPDLPEISSWTTVRTFSKVLPFFAWKPAYWDCSLRDFSSHFSSLVLTQKITGYTADRTRFFQLMFLKISPRSPETAGSCKDSDPLLTHSSRRW